MTIDVRRIIDQYLKVFPAERERLALLVEYLKKNNYQKAIDWNNFNGHIVASGFVYAKKEKQFLVLYHKDLKMFLYPGGHVNAIDKNILEAAKREVVEETGIKTFSEVKVAENELVPFDIDTHIIAYNTRLNLPEHHHFDFRYLFTIDKISDIKLDAEEHSEYKWIGIDELEKDKNFGQVVKKLEKEKIFCKKF